MSTDAEMLQRYVRARDERAFAELVQRHLGMVYGTALRRTGGRDHLAQEIAQKVFTDLARKAAGLSHHPALTGWLHRSTRYAAIDAIRAEQRGQKLTRTLATMSDDTPAAEERIEWAQLGPVLDEALDELKEGDREAMLLRFFEGLSFAEVGARLRLSENAARMRTERAMEKLRVVLGRRGVTSTSAALGLLLANQAFASAPAGLAASVTAASVAATPTAGGLVSLLVMSKITAPAVSAALAAGATVLVWNTSVNRVNAGELATLRAEHARLVAASAPGADATVANAVADEFAAQATAIAKGLAQRRAAQVAAAGAVSSSGGTKHAPVVTPRGHRDHGTATPEDAAMTFAWAGDVCDPEAFERIIVLEPPVRQKALEVLASMPEAIRTEFSTPEAFYGMLLAASCIEGPPPGADLLEKFEIVELSPGRVGHHAPGQARFIAEYQNTSDGWKYVLPLVAVDGLPGILNSRTLAKLSAH